MLGPALVRKEPVGVVGGIVPWNVPLFITMLKFAPTLASGSSTVLKPAPKTPLDAFVLAELAHEAGVPAGVLNVVPAGREVGEHLVNHPDVDKISFTGSTAAGRKIGAACGEQLKRCTLEFGGKSAAILLEDIDVEPVINELVPNYSMMNNGQACVAQTRLLAPRSRYDEIVDAVTAAASSMKIGDPADMEVGLGPLIAERSVTGWRATSPQASTRGHASPPVVGARTGWTRAGTSSRPCSWMWTTPCASPRRRSSAPSSW